MVLLIMYVVDALHKLEVLLRDVTMENLNEKSDLTKTAARARERIAVWIFHWILEISPATTPTAIALETP